MRGRKDADAARSAVHGEVREARLHSAEGSPEPAERRRLTLRHLHELIENLREEHMKLEMRVDRLAELVGRFTSPVADGRRENGPSGEPSDAVRFAAPPEPAPGAGADGGRPRGLEGDHDPAQPVSAEDRAAFGFAIWAGVERAIGNAAAMLAAGKDAGSGAPDQPADRAKAALEPAGFFRQPRLAESGQPEVPIESLLLELREAARIADEIAAYAQDAEYRTSRAHPARAPDRFGGRSGAAAGRAVTEDAALDGIPNGLAEAFGIANDGAGHGARAISSTDGADCGADGPRTGEEAVGSGADEGDVPVPNAVSAGVNGAEAPGADTGDGGADGGDIPDTDAAAGGIPGGNGNGEDGASSARPLAGAAAPAALGSTAGLAAGVSAPLAAQPSDAQTENARMTSAGHRANPPHARDADSSASGGPAPITSLYPASDMSVILIPRSERHRARKKRSLWARLFRRRHAGT